MPELSEEKKSADTVESSVPASEEIQASALMEKPATNLPAEKIPLAGIFYLFFKISTFTLGGGYVMIPLFREQIAVKKAWLSDAEILEVIAVAQSCPGIFAANVAVCVGVRLRGIIGALMATTGVAIAPFFAIVAIAGGLQALGDSVVLNNALAGVRAGVTALILITLVNLRKTAVKNWAAAFIALAAAIAIVIFQINPMAIIATAAIIGIMFYARKSA